MGEERFSERVEKNLRKSGYVEGLFDRAKQVPVETVLRHLEVTIEGTACTLIDVMERRGNEWKGKCPIGTLHGKEDTFSINDKTGLFVCYARRKDHKGGNVLEFVRLVKGVQVRDAALWLVGLQSETDDNGTETLEPEATESAVAGHRPQLPAHEMLVVQAVHVAVTRQLAGLFRSLAEGLDAKAQELAQKIAEGEP
jgi:hypothetical protein